MCSPSSVLVALAELVAAVLLGELPGDKGAWSRCGVSLLVHPLWEVRRGSRPPLGAVLEEDSQVLDAFLGELGKLADKESPSLKVRCRGCVVRDEGEVLCCEGDGVLCCEGEG